MNRNIILITFSILTCVLGMNAQVGVNTDKPKGILHIDAKSNTPAGVTTTSPQTIDDIIIDNTGNLGIGTLSPQAKLHIVTGGTAISPKVGLKIVDGTQANGKVLTSDTDGNASWKDVPQMPTAVATKVGVNIPSNTAQFYNTNSYIVLPPGRWKVTTTILVGGAQTSTVHDKVWGKGIFTESTAATVTTANMSADVEGGKIMASLLTKFSYNIMVGNVIINNKTNASKTYYFCVGAFGQVGDNAGNRSFPLVGGMANAENSIVAVLIQD